MKDLEENFMTQNKFSALVETTVQNNNGLINYIEAVASVCEAVSYTHLTLPTNREV